MEIRAKGINENEKFSCSKNDIKVLFGDMDIRINFARFHRFFQYNSEYTKSKISGKIIAYVFINYKDQTFANKKNRPSLDLFVLNNNEFNNVLQDKFVNVFLPKLRELIIANEKEDHSVKKGYYHIYVELKNSELFLHEYFAMR